MVEPVIRPWQRHIIVANRAGYSRHIGILEICHDLFDPVTGQHCIGVYAPDYVGVSSLKAGSGGEKYPLIFFLNNFRKTVAWSNLGCFVAGIVIDHNYLRGDNCLLSYRFKAVSEIVFLVISWYNYSKR